MADEILDEIQRVRQELLKKHGGLEGYFLYIMRLDRARLQRERRAKAKRATARAAKARG